MKEDDKNNDGIMNWLFVGINDVLTSKTNILYLIIGFFSILLGVFLYISKVNFHSIDLDSCHIIKDDRINFSKCVPSDINEGYLEINCPGLDMKILKVESFNYEAFFECSSKPEFKLLYTKELI